MRQRQRCVSGRQAQRWRQPAAALTLAAAAGASLGVPAWQPRGQALGPAWNSPEGGLQLLGSRATPLPPTSGS